MALQFNSARSGRQLLIREGKHVKVHVYDKKGRTKYKRAILTQIIKDYVTFKPINKNLKEIFYCIDCGIYQDMPKLNKISFITGGSITRFVLFHSAIVFLFYELATNPVVDLIVLGPVLLFGEANKSGCIPLGVRTKKTKDSHYPSSIRTLINSNP